MVTNPKGSPSANPLKLLKLILNLGVEIELDGPLF
jgi:hypothetical protein